MTAAPRRPNPRRRFRKPPLVILAMDETAVRCSGGRGRGRRGQARGSGREGDEAPASMAQRQEPWTPPRVELKGRLRRGAGRREAPPPPLGSKRLAGRWRAVSKPTRIRAGSKTTRIRAGSETTRIRVAAALRRRSKGPPTATLPFSKSV